MQSKEPNYNNSYRKTKMRLLALLFMCFLTFGSYMCYDFPGYLLNQIKKDMSLTNLQFSLLYSVYSLPNIILPLLAGIFIDSLGVRKAIFLFTFILIIGQLICSIGFHEQVKQYSIILFGRIIFGLGGECLNVTQSSVASKWFIDKDISLAMSLNLSVSRLGSVLGSFVFPQVYKIYNKQLFFPLILGCFFCIFSFTCGIFLIILDRKADKQEGKLKVVYQEENRLKIQDAIYLNHQFKLLVISSICNYMCFFPFMQILQDYLQNQYGLRNSQASNYMGIPYIISSILTPLIGLLIDRIGKRSQLLIISSIFLIFAHLFMIIMPQCGQEFDNCVNFSFIFPLILFGIFYSLYGAVFWSCIPLVVPNKILGTAFGITIGFQNGGLVIGPLIVGFIIEQTNYKQSGFFWMEIFFTSLAFMCLFIHLLIYSNDKRLDLNYEKLNEIQYEIQPIKLQDQTPK
ncbi:major facilitator superfamily protein, putative [Ichthyophthirius multifiliis]|uniref:Lysosomal dipeptide transporter MFSD1 n=1 Tax=Ichthyophthirius multifiliis TaxID=5932 RepID=G0QW56_ICHMU|nr:major facilitator superfamily protein, putative [Ichthyophthirius multifiliis]EGR30537.1 major facilitator superfamily protein, putative [Ichthyophthirius multifiliis]|eukprot:XP_004032124.1 major facilitator superfamily protein, putative [Ichthyophthirius multifiliis]